MKTLTGLESEMLAMRWGVGKRAVLKWMKARGFKDVMGLMAFGGTHAESMDRALADFWEFST